MPPGRPDTGKDRLDCVIVGAGAAGLTAAVYLARFRRRFVVVDGGGSRLRKIPTSHNYPGFVGGIHGTDVLDRLHVQATHYGVRIDSGSVTGLELLHDGSFVVDAGHARFIARTVLLATGVNDVAPPFPDVAQALADGLLRYCPICDGFEAIGKRVAVLGRGNSGLPESIFVRHFATEVHLCAIGEPLQLSDAEYRRLDEADVRVIAEPVSSIAVAPGPQPQIQLALDGAPARSPVRFDVVYAALGTLVNSGLAQRLGARTQAEGELLVDPHQQTSVPGLYAAGDVVAGLNQIAVAMGHAAIAATAIHNRLRTQ